jgi:hypothetical protein
MAHLSAAADRMGAGIMPERLEGVKARQNRDLCLDLWAAKVLFIY